MSLDFLLIDGDLDLRSEFADTRDNARLVAQHVETVLNIAIGEWLMDVREGMPWVEMALQRTRATPEVFRAAILRVLGDVDELTVTSVKTQKSGRQLTAEIRGRISTGQELVGQVFANVSAESPGNNEVFAFFAPALIAR